ncbi:MAG: hypothetical protein VX899_17295 [Myxococcota bacterium]|nr:hypothetical protein [Myxococcota bacterium]
MNRILRNTATLMGLALLASAATPIAQEAGLSVDRGQAQAANIRKTRIKQRNNGLYKSVLRVETGSGESLPASVELAFQPLDDSSGSVDTQTLSAPSKGTVLTSAEMLLYANAELEDSPGYAFLITRRAASGAAIGESISVSVDLLDGVSGEGFFEFEGGAGVVSVTDATAYVGEDAEPGVDPSLVQVDFEFESWDKENIDSVDIQLVSLSGSADAYEKEVTAELDGSTLVYKADLGADIGGGRYQTDITLYDDGGKELESGSVFLPADGADLAGSISYLKVKDTTKKESPAIRVTTRLSWSSEASLSYEAFLAGGQKVVIQDADGTRLASQTPEFVADRIVVEATQEMEEDPFAFAEQEGGYEVELGVTVWDETGELDSETYELVLDLADVQEGKVYDYESPYGEEFVNAEPHKWALHWDEESSQLVLGLSFSGDTPFLSMEDLEERLSWDLDFTGAYPNNGGDSAADLSAVWGNAKGSKVVVDAAGQTYGVSISGPDGDDIDVSATAGVNGFGSGTKKASSSTAAARPELQ